MYAAAEAGIPQQMLGDSALAFQEKVETGVETIVGVNKYIVPDEEEARPQHLKPPPKKVIDAQVKRLKAFKAARSQEAWPRRSTRSLERRESKDGQCLRGCGGRRMRGHYPWRDLRHAAQGLRLRTASDRGVICRAQGEARYSSAGLVALLVDLRPAISWQLRRSTHISDTDQTYRKCNLPRATDGIGRQRFLSSTRTAHGKRGTSHASSQVPDHSRPSDRFCTSHRLGAGPSRAAGAASRMGPDMMGPGMGYGMGRHARHEGRHATPEMRARMLDGRIAAPRPL